MLIFTIRTRKDLPTKKMMTCHEYTGQITRTVGGKFQFILSSKQSYSMSSRSTVEMFRLTALPFPKYLLLPRCVKLTSHKKLCENLFHFNFPINSPSGQSEAANSLLGHYWVNNLTPILVMHYLLGHY